MDTPIIPIPTPNPKVPPPPAAPAAIAPIVPIPVPIPPRPTTPLSPLPIIPPPAPSSRPSINDLPTSKTASISAPELKATPTDSPSITTPIAKPPLSPAAYSPIPTKPLANTTTQPINLSAETNFSEDQETLKYSIHTMAQDLERARKEDVLPDSAIKSPTTPPPPPVSPIIPAKKMAAAPTTPTPPTAPAQPAIPTLKQPISPEPTFVAAMPALKPYPMPTPPAMPTARPDVAPSPVKKISRLSFPQLNLIISILAVVIILSGSIGFSYWWFFVREAPIEPVAEEPIEPIIEEPAEPITEEPEKPIEIPEPTAPFNIVSVDSDIIIETDTKITSSESLPLLISKISSSSKETLKDKNLGRILIKYVTKTEKSYLTFQETIDLLQIKIPNNVLQDSQNGEIIAYGQNETIRYGLILKITGESLSMLDYMNSWEKTIIDDIKNLYIENLPIMIESSIFKDNFYESFVKSYINLPDTETSLDWAVSDEKKILIIATSKDMAYKIMDLISAANPLP